MVNGRSNSGQAMIELALTLPCFCLGIFMAVQLMIYGHNMLELQRMAMVSIDRLSIENYKSARRHSWFHSLFGKVFPPRDTYTSEPPATWVPFKGTSTVQDRGRIVRVTVNTRLFQGLGFTRWFPTLTQQAQAETLLESPIPEEES